MFHKSDAQECPTRVSDKPTRLSDESVPQEWHTRVTRVTRMFFRRLLRKSVLPECPTRVTNKSVPQECPTRMSYKSECSTRVACKSVPQECPTRVFCKIAPQECVPQECPTRVSHKSVLQECSARVSHKSGCYTGCPTRVHKSVPQRFPKRVFEYIHVCIRVRGFHLDFSCFSLWFLHETPFLANQLLRGTNAPSNKIIARVSKGTLYSTSLLRTSSHKRAL